MAGKHAELFDVVQPLRRLVVIGLHIGVVAGLDNQLDHFTRIPDHRIGFQLGYGGGKLRPRHLGFLGYCRTALERFGHGRGVGVRGEKLIPQLHRRLAAHAGQHQRQTLEGLFIARIGQPFQVRGDVLDMRLLKEPDAAGDGERNVAPREFELHFQRVKVRAIQHGHVVQLDAFLAQFQCALGDKGRLFIGRAAHSQYRLFARPTRSR